MQEDTEQTIKRGQIYYADLDPVVGSEQGGYRPVLIIQNDRGNRNSPTVIIAPITSKTKRKQRTHVLLNEVSALPKDSVALVEQMRTVDKSRLSDYVGKIDGNVMRRVEKAVRVSIGIKNRQNTTRGIGNEV